MGSSHTQCQSRQHEQIIHGHRKYLLSHGPLLQYDHLEPLKSKCFVWSLYSIIFNFITCLDIVTMGHFCFYLFFLFRFQWDLKGPEFRTWSGSGLKCQKWPGKGPELATRSGICWDAPGITEYILYIYTLVYSVISGASKNIHDLVANSGPFPDHFWHLGPDPDQVRNSGPLRSHWNLIKKNK